MAFMEAFIGLLLVIITLIVFMPVTNELLPTMIGDMGATTGLMVSTIAVVIIASAIFVFIRQSMSNDNSTYTEVYR